MRISIVKVVSITPTRYIVFSTKAAFMQYQELEVFDVWVSSAKTILEQA
jgi:hypothetical protein